MIVNDKCLFGNEKNFLPDECFQKKTDKPKLLLHSCCGPCSTAVVERLAGEFDVTVFFYNPCITEEEEYQKRRKAQLEFIEKFNRENIGRTRIWFMEGAHRPKDFFVEVKGLEGSGISCDQDTDENNLAALYFYVDGSQNRGLAKNYKAKLIVHLSGAGTKNGKEVTYTLPVTVTLKK